MLPDTRFKIDGSFLSALEKCCIIFCWPSWFLVRNSVLFEFFFLCMKCDASDCFKFTCFVFSFQRKLMLMFIGVDFFGLTFGVFSDSLSVHFGALAKFGKYSANISSSAFKAALSPLSF